MIHNKHYEALMPCYDFLIRRSYNAILAILNGIYLILMIGLRLKMRDITLSLTCSYVPAARTARTKQQMYVVTGIIRRSSVSSLPVLPHIFTLSSESVDRVYLPLYA